MKRSGYIKRRVSLKARRSTKRRSGRVRDTEYMLRVKQLPCCAHAPLWRCQETDGVWNNVEAHHAGERPAGRKADDDTTIPLCNYHHQCWHKGAPPFHGWTRAERRSWADARIAETQARLAHPHGSQEEGCPF